MKNEAQLVNYY